MQTRRQFLKRTGAAAGLISVAGWRLAAAGRSRSRKPNVVLVMTDDQGYYDLGCHGNDEIDTPHLDRLYSQSVRLTDFHVDPTCSPTRAALLTGRYSTRTGVWHTIMGRSLLDKNEVTIADAFKFGGYRTAIFGKWHLGDNYPFRPQDRGFDEVRIHAGGGVGQGPDYFGNDYFDDTYLHNGTWKPHKGYCTDVWFDNAMKFMAADNQRPFFCYIPTNAAHGPYNVADKYSKPYREKGVPSGRANFYGMITNIDENMGRLMAFLKEHRLAENTIVIFMTDNGTSAGPNGDMRGKKGSEYEGGHRVPFFIYWPGTDLSGGRDVERLTAHIDVMPTLLDLCGLKKPHAVGFDGKSLVPLLRGRRWPDRTLLVHSQRIDHPRKWRKSAVMTDRWRLVNGKELYDIKADPAQKKNIAGEHPAVVEELRGEYDKWWQSLTPEFDKYCRIVLGGEENPTRLMSHDWHCGNVPWSQGHIRRGTASNGFWAVQIAADGEYEFDLRRWPIEVDAPITASIPGGKAIKARTAKLAVQDIEVSKEIPADARAVTFRVQLKKGDTKVQTWFEGEGQSRGAYYAYVRRV